MAYILKLYVTDSAVGSQKAIENLKNILNEPSFEGKYKLEIIDILRHPQLAEDEKIIATPVLMKKLPPPLRRLIGDLSDKQNVLFGLDLINLEEELIK